jgi:hypothetical protein
MFYVYLHVNPETGIPFYVGKGKNRRAYDVNGRSQHHKTYFNNLLKKYSLDEIVKIVYYTENEFDAFHKEIDLIEQYGRKSNQTGSLLNLAVGGLGGDTGVSERWKKERIGEGNPNYGKTRPIEQIENIKKGIQRFFDSKDGKEFKQILSEKLKTRQESKGIVKDLIWWNDGVKNKRSKESPGIEWVKGRLPFQKSIKNNSFIHNNPKSISLEIDGVIYESKTDAMRKLNLSKWKLNKLLKESK